MAQHGMDIGEAVQCMKDGLLVTRLGWNGKPMYLYLVGGSDFLASRPPLMGIYKEGTQINYRPHIDMKTADGDHEPWVASQSDLLATDWRTVELKEISNG